MDIGLGNDADPETGPDEKFADDRYPDKGGVDVGIAGHQDNIQV